MEEFIRRLAKSYYWQGCYRQSKDLHLSLFENSKDLSKIQIIFLNWLSIYESLYQDLNMEESYISEDVVNDPIRTDAYLFWRRKCKDKIKKKEDISEEASNVLGIPKIVFKNKKSKRKK